MANQIVESTFPQLTVAGVTSSIEVSGILWHTFQVKLAAVDTNVIVGIEGSLDDTNFFEIPLPDQNDVVAVGVTGTTFSKSRVTITANGTYCLTAGKIPVKFVRFNFRSESGGTAATLDVKYYGVTWSS